MIEYRFANGSHLRNHTPAEIRRKILQGCLLFDKTSILSSQKYVTREVEQGEEMINKKFSFAFV